MPLRYMRSTCSGHNLGGAGIDLLGARAGRGQAREREKYAGPLYSRSGFRQKAAEFPHPQRLGGNFMAALQKHGGFITQGSIRSAQCQTTLKKLFFNLTFTL